MNEQELLTDCTKCGSGSGYRGLCHECRAEVNQQVVTQQRMESRAPHMLALLREEIEAYPSGYSTDPNKTEWLNKAREIIKEITQ